MHVELNGKPREIAPGTTVASLLRDLELGSGRVAVAVNGEVVARGEHETRELQAGDVVEVIHAVAGG